MDKKEYKVERKMRWISVEKKLPPFHKEFLATSPNVKYAIGWRDEDLDRKYNISLVGITHWMRLPDLPKKECEHSMRLMDCGYSYRCKNCGFEV